MHIDRPALKYEARQAMRAARPHAMLVTLLFLLLTNGLSLLIGLIVSDPVARITLLTQQGLTPDRAIPVALAEIGPVGLFLHILVAMFVLVMTFGYSRWSLNAARGEKASISDLVSGFSMAGRVLWLKALILVYGLILQIVFAMAALLAMYLLVWVLLVPFLNILALWILSFAAAILPQILLLRYSMSTYCLLDEPELGAFHAMRRSRQLMKGHIADLFFLHLSFFGWYLLAIALIATAFSAVVFAAGAVMAVAEMSIGALGVGIVVAAVLMLVLLPLMLWLHPYVSITECKFYDQLRGAQTCESPFDL